MYPPIHQDQKGVQGGKAKHLPSRRLLRRKECAWLLHRMFHPTTIRSFAYAFELLFNSKAKTMIQLINNVARVVVRLTLVGTMNRLDKKPRFTLM